jgi:hypothetical protein
LLEIVIEFSFGIGVKLDKIKREKNKENITEKEIIEILEADELFTFVGKKNKSSKSMDSGKS